MTVCSAAPNCTGTYGPLWSQIGSIRDGTCSAAYPNSTRGICAMDALCNCPEGYQLNVTLNGTKKIAECLPYNPPEECPDGSIKPPEGECLASCPSGFPPVNGQCPICPEYNSDGTCSNPSSEPASSAPNSSSPNSASAGSNGSAASTPSGGDDDGDDTPGGGGSGGGSGGNNTGGSAASASSASGTGASSGTNNSWNPYSGYGNWIPIAPDSPCPNKYQDVSGQWWCAGNTGSGTSQGTTNSAASAASAKSAGPCDPTQRDYLQCISTGNSSANNSSAQSSSAASNSSGAASSLGEKGEFDGEASEKRLEELEQDLRDKIDDIKSDISAEFGGSISGTGSIQDFCKNIRQTEVCFGMEKFEPWLDPIASAIFLVACVLAFVIVLRGQLWILFHR